MLNLIINGEQKTFDSSVITIEDLLNTLKISLRGRIVEHNGTIIAHNKCSTTKLKSFDTVEIIQFMGGG